MSYNYFSDPDTAPSSIPIVNTFPVCLLYFLTIFQEGSTVPFSISITGTPTSILSTAQISTNEMLDFESGTTQYAITIVVTDGTLTDSEMINITVVDVNDVAPVFTQSIPYTFFVSENDPSAIVGKFSHSDDYIIYLY